MQSPVKPFVSIPGDREDNIMARSGELAGLTKTRVVWRFGFVHGSDCAVAFGCSRSGFVWVIADHSGKELDRWEGYALDLPTRYRELLNKELW